VERHKLAVHKELLFTRIGIPRLSLKLERVSSTGPGVFRVQSVERNVPPISHSLSAAYFIH
jgi:hypothetical protein